MTNRLRRHRQPPVSRSPAPTRGHWIPAALILGAFTPYLGVALNARWEHLLAYAALVLVSANGRLAQSRTLPSAQKLLTYWLSLAALTLISTGRRLYFETGSFPMVRLLAILDSFLLPMAILLVAAVYASSDPIRWEKQLRRVVGVLIVLVSINSLLILVFPVEQIDGLVRQFWANPATAVGPTVADLALQGGRYGGIFNQPFDGGLGYALALMGWSFLFIIDPRQGLRRALPAISSLVLIIAGGISTGSKVFIFGSVLVVSVTTLPASRSGHSRLERFLRGAFVVAFGSAAVVVTELAEFDRYFRVLGAVGEDAGVVSGGRWRSGAEYVEKLLADLSLFGNGWRGPQDDALLSYLRGGGIIGVILFVFTYRALLRAVMRIFTDGPRLMMLGATLLMLGASFGAISLQVNRASSIFWVLLGLTFGHVGKRPNRSSTRSAGGATQGSAAPNSGSVG
jgi:hypothetical protein